MKIRSVASLFIFALASAPVFAESNWIQIAASEDNMTEWHAQPGSLEFSKTKGGIPIAVVVGRITNKRTSQVDLYKWYVSGADCSKRMGKVATLNISGEFQFDNDFVMGSGNIASAIAETICGAADYRINETKDKSL